MQKKVWRVEHPALSNGDCECCKITPAQILESQKTDKGLQKIENASKIDPFYPINELTVERQVANDKHTDKDRHLAFGSLIAQ